MVVSVFDQIGERYIFAVEIPKFELISDFPFFLLVALTQQPRRVNLAVW